MRRKENVPAKAAARVSREGGEQDVMPEPARSEAAPENGEMGDDSGARKGRAGGRDHAMDVRRDADSDSDIATKRSTTAAATEYAMPDASVDDGPETMFTGHVQPMGGHELAEFDMNRSATSGATAEPGLAFADYLPTRSDVHAGEAGEDVLRLQRYLELTGFLGSDRIQAFGIPRSRAAAESAHRGEFDESTEIALRSFQQFHGLPVTGVVDDATRGLMAIKRCGFPDVGEYVLQGNKWPTTSLKYGLSEITPDLSAAQVRAAIVQAFNLWSAVTPLQFTEVPMSGSPDIVIRFVSGDHGDGSPFDAAGGVLAHAFYPPPNGGAIAGDTHMDEAETWSVNLPPSGTDLVTVIAHEFGHALGLAHSTINGALMYPYYSGPHRYLHVDDIAGIQALYGANAAWSGWENLGGFCTDGVAVSSWAPNRLDCFVVGNDRALWHRWWNGTAWSGWENLGGQCYSTPAAVSWGPNRIDVCVIGGNRAMWHKWWNGSAWSGWENLGGLCTDGVAISSWAANRLDCFVIGNDRALWHKWWNGAAWSNWESLGGQCYSTPAAVSWGPNRIDAFVIGGNRAMWHRWWTGSAWSGWESLGGLCTDGVAASSRSTNRLDCFVVGNDRALWQRQWNGSNWGGWQSLGGQLYSTPAAVSWDANRIDAFGIGGDHAMWHKWYA